jgi:hypothetical protein
MSRGAWSTIIKPGAINVMNRCSLKLGIKQKLLVCTFFLPCQSAFESIVANRPWDKAVTTLQFQGVPLSLAFHAYDPHVAIASEADIIRSVLQIGVARRGL